MLEGEGRIVRVADSGTHVAERRATVGAADVARLSSPAHVMEARLMTEPRLARAVRANATAIDFAETRRCVEGSAGAGAAGAEVSEAWDAALHEAAARATKNPMMAKACRIVTRARDGGKWGELKRQSLTPERRALYQADHEHIVEALGRRVARAGEEAMRIHLLRIRENMLGF